MLQSIKIQNFQAHENTTLNLSKGINAITGVSDSGKSSVTRAINWVMTNRPTGTAFSSHWAEKDGTKVALNFDGTIIERHRSKTKNSYRLGKQKFDVVKTDVPEEVQQFINLEPINLQGQHERYFLMQDTPGEVARKLNKIANLDIIDFALAEVDSAIRENSQNIKISETGIENIEENLKKYEHLDAVETILTQLEQWTEEEAEIHETISILNETINYIEETTDQIQTIEDWLTIEENALSIEKKRNMLASLSRDYDRMKLIVSAIEDLETTIHYLQQFLGCETSVNRLLTDLGTLQNLQKESYTLQVTIQSITDVEKDIQTLFDRISCETDVNGILAYIETYNDVTMALRALYKLILEIDLTTDAITEFEERIAKAIEKAVHLIRQNNVCPLCGNEINESTIEHVKGWL